MSTAVVKATYNLLTDLFMGTTRSFEDCGAILKSSKDELKEEQALLKCFVHFGFNPARDTLESWEIPDSDYARGLRALSSAEWADWVRTRGFELRQYHALICSSDSPIDERYFNRTNLTRGIFSEYIWSNFSDIEGHSAFLEGSYPLNPVNLCLFHSFKWALKAEEQERGEVLKRSIVPGLQFGRYNRCMTGLVSNDLIPSTGLQEATDEETLYKHFLTAMGYDFFQSMLLVYEYGLGQDSDGKEAVFSYRYNETDRCLELDQKHVQLTELYRLILSETDRLYDLRVNQAPMRHRSFSVEEASSSSSHGKVARK